MKEDDTFGEEYIVKFDYFDKKTGFWVCSHEEDVVIRVVHGVNEKANHDKARKIIEKKYPKCVIKSVTYV